MTQTIFYVQRKSSSPFPDYNEPKMGVIYRVVLKPKRFKYDGEWETNVWAYFYNSEGERVWDCNDGYFETHFFEVPAPDWAKKKKRATGSRKQTVREHTPGPWKWVVNPKSHSVELSRGSYGDIVMSFERWGMSGATPMFNVNGVLERAADISEPEDKRMHHADWWRVINHPDANLIAAAPEMLEALEAVLFQNERGICSDCTARWPQCECDLGEWWRKSMAAVRKAKGEKP